MNDDILNLAQAAGFLGISEKTMIKLLREEHVPARKIGREWRFSREALTRWLAAGDSLQYINQDDRYMVFRDIPCMSSNLYNTMREKIECLRENGGRLNSLLPELNRTLSLPKQTTLRISYKQQREIEKLELKVFWSLRESCKMEPASQKPPVK